MSRAITKTDPNDWAKKRKEAMDRAKQKREERKNGIPEEEENHTFKPQINKRPQYLKKEENVSNNPLPHHDPNDIFEKPLPGVRGQQQFHELIESGVPTPQPLSTYSKSNTNTSNRIGNGYSNNNSNNNNGNGIGNEIRNQPTKPTRVNEGNSNYKSKFMQQYEQPNQEDSPTTSSYQPPQKSKAELEAEETFMGTLRGNSNNSGGSGWNDDTSNTSIPAVPKKVSYRRRKSTDQNKSNNNAPPPSSRPSPRQQAMPEWNSDAGNGIPPIAPNQQYLRRENIQSSPSNINRGIDSAGNGGVSDVSQVRSRLSLLKSKMKKTESGGDLRSLSASEKERERQRPIQRDRGDEWDAPPLEPPQAQPRGGRRQQQQPSNPTRSTYDQNDHYNYDNPPPPQNRRVGEARQQYALQAAQERDQEEPYQRNSYQNLPKTPKNQQQAYPSNRSEPPYNGRQQDENEDRNPYPPRQSEARSSSFNIDAEFDEGIGLGEQLECPDCGRKFNRIPYEKHVKICAKIFIQKRKVFDSKKKRMNEELEQLQKAEQQNARMNKKKGGKQQQGGGGGGGDDRAIQGERNPKWKEQSNQFREAMKQARLLKQAEATGGPLPEFKPSVPDPSLIRCQNCGRTFNERAAERHIPLCSNIRAKPTSLKRGSGGAGGKTGTVAGSVSLGTTTGAKPSATRKR